MNVKKAEELGQICWVAGDIVTTGEGFTTTVNWNVVLQVPKVAVIVYMALTFPVLPFNKVWLIEVCPICAVAPVNPVPVGIPQLYNTPVETISGSVFGGEYVKPDPEQVVNDLFVMTGFGFTVTITLNVLVQILGETPTLAVTK